MRERIAIAGIGLDSWVKLEQGVTLPFLGVPCVSRGDSKQSWASCHCGRSPPCRQSGESCDSPGNSA